MNKNKIKKIFVVFILFLSFFIIFFLVNNIFIISKNRVKPQESFDDNSFSKQWVILLTTCVTPFNATDKDAEDRKELYKKQIQNWLEHTNIPIFVVESSKNTSIFENLNLDNNDKLTYYTLTANNTYGSSYGEMTSIKYALEFMKENSYYNEANYILKVTGRYFLNDIENVLNNLEKGGDIYLQKRRINEWQNSEYYGMKKDLFENFVDGYDMNVKELVETYLYKYSLNKNYMVIPPFENDIPRGGDKLILNPL